MSAGAARVGRLAAGDRTAGRNSWLAALLALVAGTLNSVGFVAVSVCTSHMTGITASIADHRAWPTRPRWRIANMSSWWFSVSPWG